MCTGMQYLINEKPLMGDRIWVSLRSVSECKQIQNDKSNSIFFLIFKDLIVYNTCLLEVTSF